MTYIIFLSVEFILKGYFKALARHFETHTKIFNLKNRLWAKSTK